MVKMSRRPAHTLDRENELLAMEEKRLDAQSDARKKMYATAAAEKTKLLSGLKRRLEETAKYSAKWSKLLKLDNAADDSERTS